MDAGTAEGLAETADIANGPCLMVGDRMPSPVHDVCQCAGADLARRPDYRGVPLTRLVHLYVCEGLSTYRAGQLTGLDRQRVTRALRQLIDALYADDLVRATLAEHEIAEVPAGGPIWSRFPEPVPLTRQLVADLYWRCGVGLTHIELVTGQPAHTVRAFMRRAGLAVRDPGGRSPFLRRWHTVSGETGG